MNRSIVWAVLLISILGVILAADSQPTHPDEILDAPGGRPIGILLPGATRRIVEERDGYVKVVVEGWIRSETAAGQGRQEASPSPTGIQPGAPQAAATTGPSIAATGAAATVAGRIEIRLPSGEVHYGAGARVVALGNVPELERRRTSLSADYLAGAGRLKAEIASLEEQKKQALNSSDNLSQATQNLDRAKTDLAQKNRELDELEKKYAAMGESLLMEFRVTEALADPGGAYHFEGLAPGEYRLWATFGDGVSAYRWYLPLSLSPGKATQLDLSGANAGKNPFLQLP